MSSRCRVLEVARSVVLVAMLAGSFACDRTSSDRPRASARPSGATTNATPAPPPARTNVWEAAVGPLIALSVADTPEDAQVILPGFTEATVVDTMSIDLKPVSNTRLDLFSRSGLLGTAILTAGVVAQSGSECHGWPQGQLSQTTPGWRVALAAGRATAIPLDSLETMSAADSTALVVNVARLASALPSTEDPVFRGLPFAVGGAYRLHTDSADVIVADVMRSINSEANPREEHLLLIAERQGGAGGLYRTAYSARTAGREEAAPVSDVLAAVTLAASHHAALIVSTESDDGGTVDLIERVAPGEWRMVWRSPYSNGC